MDQPLLDRAKDYQKIRQRLTLLHLALTPLMLFLAVATPLSSLFKSWAGQIANGDYVVAAFYFLFFTCYSLIVDFPFSYYSGFAIEHRFKLSNHSLKSWLADFAKKSLLSFGLSLALTLALYALIWNFPKHWWVLGWLGYFFVSYVLGKLFPVLIVPLFYKYAPLPDPALKDRIVRLADRYGLPVENVYSLNLSKTTKKANAAFMGMGKTKRVVLSDTLLEHFSHEEIETVIAHELGHFKHRDIWKQLIFGMITSLIAFRIAFETFGGLAARFHFDGAGDVAALPLLFLVFYCFYLLLMPLQNGFSRWIERAADRFALAAYPHADVFISCMDKLGRVNLADPSPHPIFEWFFYDHPAIAKRIRMAQLWKEKRTA